MLLVYPASYCVSLYMCTELGDTSQGVSHASHPTRALTSTDQIVRTRSTKMLDKTGSVGKIEGAVTNEVPSQELVEMNCILAEGSEP